MLARGSDTPGTPRASTAGLLQLDAVAGRVVQERLAPGADRGRVGDAQAAPAQFGDRAVQVGDGQGEVLAPVRRHVRLDEVYLLAARVQPGPVEAEVGPVGALGQA